MTNIPNDKRALDYGSAFAVKDAKTSELLHTPLDLSVLDSNTVVEDFLNTYNLSLIHI